MYNLLINEYSLLFFNATNQAININMIIQINIQFNINIILEYFNNI